MCSFTQVMTGPSVSAMITVTIPSVDPSIKPIAHAATSQQIRRNQFFHKPRKEIETVSNQKHIRNCSPADLFSCKHNDHDQEQTVKYRLPGSKRPPDRL